MSSSFSSPADYLTVPHSLTPSFHFRTGKVPRLPVAERPSKVANQFGYPRPGIQSPTPALATAAHYFVDNNTWDAILDHGDFDDIVVGSGFCALAYVDEALKRDPWRKILILERGEVGFMHGSCPFFGGRSTFWSAWCPQPTLDLMRGFPDSMKRTTQSEDFWKDCKDLLHVTPADQISNQIFGELQKDIDQKLTKALNANRIHTADTTEAAPLAVGKTSPTSQLAFNKFSTPGALLDIYERQRKLTKANKGRPLMIATDCIVQRFQTDENEGHVVRVLETSRGALCFPDGRTNIILAAGAIPNTNILLNSLESMQTRAGSRVTGHFLTHIAARFPKNKLRYSRLGNESFHLKEDKLEIAASYLAGRDPRSNMQYHVQITAIHSPHPEQDAVDAGRECPDYAAAATAEQLEGSEDYIVLVCASLGELDEENRDSWLRRNPQDPDLTTNVKLQITLSEKDHSLWDIMDHATQTDLFSYDAIAAMADDEVRNLQYWHNSSGWSSRKPPVSEIRVPGIVHEGSTLYMGPQGDPAAAVDDRYRPYGCQNVYVTGAALFPAAGSWNPTLTMCGFAQDLARKLVPKREA
ncbi:hypothetical protein EW026_g6015 [Hermanssonia centrifuga]|uniref:Glucose-methanol-choline oxidoreductase C-terminal domain-containing protein n=1 Tax=Hermanssonia centrifuga TaxID=98765 RepID=A0A4S4KCB1_9APHY|nr:hypothetical protein EW026_g6015 [Hermanssonia centrifuga]